MVGLVGGRLCLVDGQAAVGVDGHVVEPATGGQAGRANWWNGTPAEENSFLFQKYLYFEIVVDIFDRQTLIFWHREAYTLTRVNLHLMQLVYLPG